MPTLQSIGRSNYRHYASAVAGVGRSSEKLAKGEKLATFGGASDIAIANRIDREARGDAMLLPAIQDGMGMVTLQENTVSQFADIVSRMYELAASAQDTSKSASDLMALGQEFSSLVIVVTNMATNLTWEAVLPLSATAINQAISVTSAGASNTINIAMTASSCAAALIVGLGVLGADSVASGATAMTNLLAAAGTSSAAGSVLSAMTAQVGANMRELEIAYSRQLTYINAKENTQEAIREVDPIQEVAVFTTQSVRLNTAQVVQTQANNLISSLNRFLQSM